tara:strand:+ start:494 stop:1036 length:543 start_codon:yes stop_codon:yes gene_type:complete
MYIGFDISTSITGVTVIDENGKMILNESWDTRKYKSFFKKASVIAENIEELALSFPSNKEKKIFIEQSLQSFRSGFSSAKTLSTLSRFNGIVSWVLYQTFEQEPEYLAAPTARKMCGVKVPRGTKAKERVLEFVLDSELDFCLEYTRNGNPTPEAYDRADSFIIAKAGYLQCQKRKSAES